jgi:uncharacterized SAM-binding protein YcdF (DUF218 family)
MRWFFRLLFRLVAAAIFIFLSTAAWIVFDGLTDFGEKADVALVLGQAGPDQLTSERPSLDRVIELYQAGDFSSIIVSGPAPGLDEAPGGMESYLARHGIPSSVLIKLETGGTARAMARRVAAIMKARQFESVIIVSDYYRMTLTKLALSHEGTLEVGKAHVGKLQTGDALKIGRQVVALYEYLGKYYFLPEAEKVRKEAQAGMDKASVDAENAKKKVDKSIDNLSK